MEQDKTAQLHFPNRMSMSFGHCEQSIDIIWEDQPRDSEAWHPICHVTTFSFLRMSHLMPVWGPLFHFEAFFSSFFLISPPVFLTGHSHSFPWALLVFLLYHSIWVLGPLEPIFLNTNTGLSWCLFCPGNSTNTFTDPDIFIFLLHLHRASRSILLPWFACWIYTWTHSPSQKTLGTSD